MNKVIKEQKRQKVTASESASVSSRTSSKGKGKGKLISAEENWGLMEMHFLDGNLEKALAVGKKALTNPTEPSCEIMTRRYVSKMYLCMSAFNESEEQLREALKLDDRDSNLWFDLGLCLSQQGKIEEAAKAFQKLVEIDIHNLDILDNHGDAIGVLDQPEMAMGPLPRSTPCSTLLRHEFSEAHYHLSEVFWELKNYQELEKSARAALHYDPERMYHRVSLGVAAMEHLGLALSGQGRYEEAEKCFRQNLGHATLTYYNLGAMFFGMKRYNDALDNYRRALELDPENPHYNNVLGDTYDKMGKLDEAEKYLRCAIEIDKNYAIGHCDLGVFLSRRRGLKEEALAAFDQALRINPYMVESYYGIACTYAFSQEEGPALSFLKKAMQKGFRDIAQIENDSDWTGLRTSPKFIRLLDKYRET